MHHHIHLLFIIKDYNKIKNKNKNIRCEEQFNEFKLYVNYYLSRIKNI